MPQPLAVQEVRSLREFEAIEAEWDHLFRTAVESVPMVSHAWLRAWWRAFAMDLDCRVVLVRSAGELVAAAPIVIQQKQLFGARLRVISLFSNTWVDRSQLLLRAYDPAPVETLLIHLCRSVSFDVLDLYPWDDASAQTKLIVDCAERLGFNVGSEEHLQSPFMKLPRTWDQVMEGLSSSFRQSLRRKIRKIESMGNVTTRVVTDPTCLDAIEKISLESWQHDEGTSMASNETILTFYTTIIQAAARDGSLHCALMEVDGEPAAFEFNLLHRSTLHNFKLGFRKRFNELSTGMVLKAHVLQALLASGAAPRLDEYDFMGTTEPYKLNWSKSIRSHSRYVVFRRSLRLTPIYWAHFKCKPWIGHHMPWLKRALKSFKSQFRRRD